MDHTEPSSGSDPRRDPAGARPTSSAGSPPPTDGAGTTPFGVVAAVEHARPARKGELLALTRALELRALSAPPAFVTATLQDVRYLTRRTREVYTQLAAAGARATLLGAGLTSWIAPGVTGVALEESDPLVDEWVLVLPVAGAPTVFAATDLDISYEDDMDRTFCYAVSYDPEVVDECARLLVVAERR